MTDTEFRGISKEDHDVLTKAADMYTKLTGEPVKAIGQIPVAAAAETDPTVIQKLAEEQLTLQAEVTAKREAAQQAERQLQANRKSSPSWRRLPLSRPRDRRPRRPRSATRCRRPRPPSGSR